MTNRNRALRVALLCLCYDLLTAGISMYVAVELRYWLESMSEYPRPYPVGMVQLATVLFMLTAATSLLFLGVHRQVWRYFGRHDGFRLVQASLLAMALFLPILFFTNRLDGFPRTSILIVVALWLALMFAGRLLAVLFATGRAVDLWKGTHADAPYALLVGSAEDVTVLIGRMRQNDMELPMRPLGLIEVSGENIGRVVQGIPVLGTPQDLPGLIESERRRLNMPPVIALMGRPAPSLIDEIAEIAAESKTRLLKVSGSQERLRSIRPSDLLNRPERKLDPAPVKSLIAGKSVVVTGAGGTIGSELVRQVAAFGPSQLTLFEASEFNLYSIDMDLKRDFPGIPRATMLGDVRNPTRVREALAMSNADIVIHAAALKHVPLMEENPAETVLTNVLGAKVVADAAIEHGVDHFVFISTDKAVEPANIMGATKRTAELYLQKAARSAQKTRFSLVRFGNVLGSSGSVVPLFEKQIAEGGPVTVTDPEITRYFMTVEEAVSLVLQAAALTSRANDTGLYVLDMGEAVKIKDLAEAMIRLNGHIPYETIKITFTGLRAGEKLHERVFYGNEDISNTDVDGVLKVAMNGALNKLPDNCFDLLIDAAKRHDISSLKSELTDITQKSSAH